jgi:hypothetical protein
MKEIIQYLQQLSAAISWPVAALIIILLLRKQIALLFTVLGNWLSKAGEIEIDGKKITIKALAQQVAETKQELKETKQELTDIVTTGPPTKEAYNKLKNIGEEATIKTHGVRIPGLNIESFKGEDIAAEMKTISAKEIISSRMKDDNPVPVSDPIDPQAGRWGGQRIKGNRELAATVEPLPNNLYKIKLLVKSTSSIDPLKGKVIFHLHPTFANANPEAEVTDGIATLTLMAWGSFTVGAETDDKNIKLEYNLAGIPGVPQHFIDN